MEREAEHNDKPAESTGLYVAGSSQEPNDRRRHLSSGITLGESSEAERPWKHSLRRMIKDRQKARDGATAPASSIESAPVQGMPSGKTVSPVEESFCVYQISSASLRSGHKLDVVIVHGLGKLFEPVKLTKAAELGHLEARQMLHQAPSTSAKSPKVSAESQNSPVGRSRGEASDRMLSKLPMSLNNVFTHEPADGIEGNQNSARHGQGSSETPHGKRKDMRMQLSTTLKKLAQDLEFVRFLVFEYPEIPREGGQSSFISNVMDQFRHRLDDFRRNCTERPILFMGYEFGNIVIQQQLIMRARDPSPLNQLCSVTAGVTFLLSPDQSSENVNQKKIYFDIMRQRHLLTAISPNKDGLPKFLSSFAEMAGTDESFFVKQLKDFMDVHEHIAAFGPAIALTSHVFDGVDVVRKIYQFIDDSFQTYKLLDAAGKGDLGVLKALLGSDRLNVPLSTTSRQKVDANLRDSLGRSALHQAVRGNHLGVVTFLLNVPGVDVSVKDSKGRNVLHYAALYCSGQTLMDMVSLLVKAGVMLEALDSSGLSAEHAILSKGVSKALLQTSYMMSRDERPTTRSIPSPPDSEAAQQACRDCLATLAEFHLFEGQEELLLQHETVYDLLYESNGGPEQRLSSARGSHLKQEPQCRWYHLPANHLGWVDDLFARLGITTEPLQQDQHNGQPYWSRYMRPQARVFEYSQSSRISSPDVAEGFVMFMPFLNFERRCDQVVLSKFAEGIEANRQWIEGLQTFLGKQPREVSSSKLEDESEKDDTLAPTDSTSLLGGLPAWRSSSTTSDIRSENKPDPLQSEKALLMGYLMSVPALSHQRWTLGFHQRRTLDQSHYFMLKDTSQRDKDQVVLRRARGDWLDYSKDPPENEPYRLMMVDQLWIWVIGSTIVTSFPQSWKQGDFQRECDVLEQLLKHLLTNKRRAPIMTAHDLANLVTRHCVNVLNQRPDLESMQLRDYFEESVRLVADYQVKLFLGFEKDSTNDVMKYNSTRSSRRALNRMLAIREEIKLLVELKDIRDELNMILRILNDQDATVREMLSIVQQEHLFVESPRHSPSERNPGLADEVSWTPLRVTTERSPSKTGGPQRWGHSTAHAYKLLYQVIQDNIRDFSRMLDHANLSYEELNHLLDLKQKQTNAWEAHLARVGAENSARQSNTITVFTVATIIFGSFSFVTAFFALNVQAFPQENGEISWPLSHAIGYIVVWSVSICFPFIFIAFKINFLERKVISFIGLLTKKPKPRGKRREDGDYDSEPDEGFESRKSGPKNEPGSDSSIEGDHARATGTSSSKRKRATRRLQEVSGIRHRSTSKCMEEKLGDGSSAGAITTVVTERHSHDGESGRCESLVSKPGLLPRFRQAFAIRKSQPN